MAKKEKRKIIVDFKNNKLLEKVMGIINADQEIATLWNITNTTAIKRLGMTDHGIMHFQIVINNALKIQRLLKKHGVKMSVTSDFQLPYEYAEVIVAVSSLLHDLGMSIHRIGHEEYSLFLVNALLKNLFIFMPIKERTIVISDILHAIISHRGDGKPLTVEAGIVRVADALDMTEGRSRIPYEEGKINVYSVSSMSIDEIYVREGDKTPVRIDIIMNHTAGVFQVDELLRRKVTGSGIEKYLEIHVYLLRDNKKVLFKNFM